MLRQILTLVETAPKYCHIGVKLVNVEVPGYGGICNNATTSLKESNLSPGVKKLVYDVRSDVGFKKSMSHLSQYAGKRKSVPGLDLLFHVIYRVPCITQCYLKVLPFTVDIGEPLRQHVFYYLRRRTCPEIWMLVRQKKDTSKRLTVVLKDYMEKMPFKLIDQIMLNLETI
ncbi:hypothetical protein RF11_11152 [Thelohanellus kitauei]|uniref:Uncharacterized protein n=1 Tax=Thelohanellus kitauei TaxID=669202 RepID=A0A0C2JTT3_THEKT|nr:hypothetical protein RF11_11152 [Thelohanellus kitauei]